MPRRRLLPLVLTAVLMLSTTVHAQEDDTDTSTTDQPSGPVPSLTALRPQAPICGLAGVGGRYLEIKGTGFDAWVDQRLPGQLLDADGNLEGRWRTIWVDPGGNVDMAVNLCDDVAAQRGPLAPGTHFVMIGTGSDGDPIAYTSFDLVEEAALPTPVPVPQPQAPGSAPVVQVQPINPSFPGGQRLGTPAPFALPTATPVPGRAGPGTLQQPLPLGSTITLFDNWQLTVTGVTPDAWSGIHSAVPSNIGPAPQLQYFVVRVQAIYTGTGSGLFSDLRLGVIGPNGGTYDQVNNSCGLIPDEVPPTVQANGGVTRGNVCFAVRTSDQGSLELFDTLAPEAQRTYVALH